MSAICPNCKAALPQAGFRCPHDGWFAIDEENYLPGNHILGRPLADSFVALKKIGQGGMGTVYEGKQIQLGRIVAIKILSKLHLTDQLITARFEREAKSIARVVHPNVVQLIDSGVENNDIAYIVMEYVKGVELSKIAESEITAESIVHIARQVLNALAEAHSMNVIHRDLKPDNIMLTQEDGDRHFVKVLDFGLATLTDRPKLTFTGQALGTPWYMSPEQASASEIGETSDLYSLGCILYELLTSKPPFPGNRPYNVMMQHVNAQVPPIVPRKGIFPSPGLINFILKCLEKKPEDRYASAKLALDALNVLPECIAPSQPDANLSLQITMQQLTESSATNPAVETEDASNNGLSNSISEAISGILSPVEQEEKSEIPPQPAHPAYQPPAPIETAPSRRIAIFIIISAVIILGLMAWFITHNV